MTTSAGSPVERVGQRLGLTEGQVYTAAIGLVVGLWAAVVGIPPTLVDRVLPDAGAAAPVAPIGAEEAASPPSSTVPPVDPGAGVGLPSMPAFGAGSAAGSGGGWSFDGDSGSVGGGGATTDGDGGAKEPAQPFGTVSVFAPVPPPGAPEGIVVARDGRVIVATNSASSKPVVFRFTAEGDVETTTTLEGVEAGDGVRGLASDGSADVVYAVVARPAAVLRVDLVTGTASTYTTVPDLPACVAVVLAGACEYSPVDNPPAPRAATFGADGSLYVVDAGQAVVWRVPAAGAEPEVFHQAVEYVSTDGLSGVGVDSAGRLVLTVAAAPTEAQGGVVYRLVDGTLTKVASVPAGERPVGVAGGPSGRLYVALAGAGRLLVLDEDGNEVARLPKPEDTALDTPVGVALRGSDALVTEQAPSRPLGGRVVRISVAD